MTVFHFVHVTLVWLFGIDLSIEQSHSKSMIRRRKLMFKVLIILKYQISLTLLQAFTTSKEKKCECDSVSLLFTIYLLYIKRSRGMELDMSNIN